MEKRNAKGLTEAEFLAQYHPTDYDRPSVTVDVLLFRMRRDFKGLQLLLIQRKDHPYMDAWALPGGFLNMEESAYQAACRELEEETSLTDIYLEQIYTMSRPERDPRMRVIDIAYAALLPFGDSSQPIAGDDAREAKWFDISFQEKELGLCAEDNSVQILYRLKEKLFVNGRVKIRNYIPVLKTEEALAFDHAEILLEALSRMRNKVKYTDIAFNLVPEEFTLTDLQVVYEVLLGQKLYKSNFRESVEQRITETGSRARPITSSRQAKLYRYTP